MKGTHGGRKNNILSVFTLFLPILDSLIGYNHLSTTDANALPVGVLGLPILDCDKLAGIAPQLVPGMPVRARSVGSRDGAARLIGTATDGGGGCLQTAQGCSSQGGCDSFSVVHRCHVCARAFLLFQNRCGLCPV